MTSQLNLTEVLCSPDVGYTLVSIGRLDDADLSQSHKPILAPQPRYVPSLPTVPQGDTEQGLPIDHDQIRRRQSTAYTRGPRPSLNFRSPYNQDPTKLIGSDGLEEMFQTPAPNRRRTIFSIPESSVVPSRTHGVSGGAPPPGGDPSDDESSDPPHTPSRYPPILPQLLSGGRSNPPGRPDDSGPPDGGNGAGAGGSGDPNPYRGDVL
ncbi:hypothetical protein JB92DRAFT_3135386 [Gautieria morchelliformis]|nr:hypothetical protein JB92DRAFT_3135386 [Gautieria morchelliformis]